MARKPKGRRIHGWLVLDKPEGPTSTQALNQVKRLTEAAKAGHGGTLDPIATGVLPIAFGEATKLLPFIVDRTKLYRFRIRWGEARDTDDREGAVTATSDHRPSADEIIAALPQFLGEIQQVPPQYSAIKIAGQRAYDLARDGEVVELAPRAVQVDRFALVGQPDADHADFEVSCGKGTYMRSLARDLSLALGTVGHVAALRRLAVGAFTEARAISLDQMQAAAQTSGVAGLLLPIETALDDIPALALTDAEAQRLKLGQPIALLQRQDRERLLGLQRTSDDDGDLVLAMFAGRPLAIARVEGAEVRPVRVLNF
ncbi:MAG: tRNA pseudouridine(55) synthase TruB [Azospirillum sp.]|nr:tRNA pseudouridine(55) synthase TruB [Azospirillum sp.]